MDYCESSFQCGEALVLPVLLWFQFGSVFVQVRVHRTEWSSGHIRKNSASQFSNQFNIHLLVVKFRWCLLPWWWQHYSRHRQMSYWRNMTSTVSLPSPKSTIPLKEVLGWVDLIVLLQVCMFSLTPLKLLTPSENYWNIQTKLLTSL